MKEQPKKTEKEALKPRPPVVAVLGHIDHGKTTLLDYIRKSAVAEKEAGGITQHVSAYEVSHKDGNGKDKSITFIDTPGHEAFASIRSRGARIADIGILVVSGEDGVKPQTIEALKFINESKLPYIVAITKIDKPSANLERAKQGLLEKEIYVEGYGGSIPCVAVSAVSGEGINDLLDMILLVAEVENISGDVKKPAEGVVLEASRSKEQGIVATLILKDGTLEKNMVIVAGDAFCNIKQMTNFLGKKTHSVASGSPTTLTGWDKMPKAGDEFLSFPTKKEAENYLLHRPTASAKKVERTKNSSEERVAIPIVIKADVTGTLEAVEYELKKLATEKVFLKIIQAGTGPVNESDIKIATGDNHALVFGLNVKVDGPARSLAERDGVVIELFDIIYKLVERAQVISVERTPKIESAEIRGKAKIIRFFSSTKDKQIIGGKVTEGSIGLGDEILIMRRDAEVGKGRIRELQQQKMKTDSVETGREFGAMVEARIEIAPGDVLESFVIVKK